MKSIGFLFAIVFLGILNVNAQVKQPDRAKKQTIIMAEPFVNIQNSAERVSIYPNPNTGVFYVKVENFNEGPAMAIYNLNDEHVVYEGKLSKSLNTINLSAFAKGIYVYEVYAPVTGNLMLSGKITVQ